MIELRPFTPQDYEKTVALRNQISPESPSTVEIWQHGDRNRHINAIYHRVLVEQAGELLGYGDCGQIGLKGRKFFLNMHFLDWETAVVSQLYDHLFNLCQTHSPRVILSEARENETAKLAFLENQAFQTVSRAPVSHLDVQNFKVGPFKGMIKQAILSNITVKQLEKDWVQDEKFQRLVFDLYWKILQDIPHHDERNKEDSIDYFHAELTHPNFMPEGYFVALEKGKMIGMTNLVKRGQTTTQLATDITGVVRGRRRRGIATMLKIAAIQYAQSIGTETIITNNEENNPMFSLNQTLGFVPQPAWLTLKRDMATD